VIEPRRPLFKLKNWEQIKCSGLKERDELLTGLKGIKERPEDRVGGSRTKVNKIKLKSVAFPAGKRVVGGRKVVHITAMGEKTRKRGVVNKRAPTNPRGVTRRSWRGELGLSVADKLPLVQETRFKTRRVSHPKVHGHKEGCRKNQNQQTRGVHEP